jgi:hypothetical protein
MLAPMLPGPASAQGEGVYLATFVDVMPNAVTSSAALLAQYRKVGSNLCFNVLHQIARPDRLAILEIWQNKAALHGHDKVVSSLHFRDGRQDGSECALRRAGKKQNLC